MQPFVEQPQFTLEPNSSFIFENRPVTLECKAIRTRQIFFNCDNKWVPEHEHTKSTETNDKGLVTIITSIDITSEQLESQLDSNGYKCFCQAWSATGGTLKSRTATIEIAYLDKVFEWEPLRTDSVISKSAELRCRPPSGNPYPKVTWLKDDQPVEINRSGRFILSNENSLLIAQIKRTDAGNYTCVASNIAGMYSSEPAELIVHEDRGWSDWQPFSECKGIPCGTGRQRRIRTCLNPPTITNRPSCDGDQVQERECPVTCPQNLASRQGVIVPPDSGFSEWSPWSECIGVSCQMGHQQRIRACLKSSLSAGKRSVCDGEQIQEQNCRVPCPKPDVVPSSSNGVYSNWTDWSICQPPECTSMRARHCLQQPCLDRLLESRSCKSNFCPSTGSGSGALLSSSALNVIVYSSAGIGALIFLLLAFLFVLLCWRRRQRITSQKALSTCITSKATCSSSGGGSSSDKTDYPFYYSIQQDTTSTRSCVSQNNSVSLTNSELSGVEKEKLLLTESPLSKDLRQLYAIKSNHLHPTTLSTTSYTSSLVPNPSVASRSIHNQHSLNMIYEKIVQSLPAHTDLRYFAVSVLNNKGCRFEIPQTGVSLIIPEDAVLLDDDHLVFIAVLTVENQMPPITDGESRLSPVVLIGPPEITLLKPAVLSFEHTALLPPIGSESTWKLSLMHSDDILNWKRILIQGQENISTPVYMQFNGQQAFILFETMGAYALIGESLPNRRASKCIQMAAFFNRSSSSSGTNNEIVTTLRLRFFDASSDAWERCLTEEMSLHNYLCEKPKQFIVHDCFDQICINVDFELSSTSRINIGYKEIPLPVFWSSRIDRSCFIFIIPDLQIKGNLGGSGTQSIIDHLAMHIDVYQPTILDSALHTRLCVNTLSLLHNSGFNTTASLRHRPQMKSPEKVSRLPPAIRQKLCQALDPPNALGNDWRMFASNLLGIDYLQYFATKSSPTEHLLTLWDARQESLVNMINVLNQIGRSDAACIIINQMHITN